MFSKKEFSASFTFNLSNLIDLIALSFTRKGSDIEYVRDILGPRGSNIKIISKIEN